MIKIAKKPYEDDVIPHAIFWRRLKYFSNAIRRGLDELDEYSAVSFERGNKARFDLRVYDGHPEDTTSLYLPVYIQELKEVLENVREIISELSVPKTAIAWQRNKNDDMTLHKRTDRDRLREDEARILALKIASLQPKRTASTEQIKKQIQEYMYLTELDLSKSKTRPREAVWQQIIGNVISHRASPKGPFRKGYAVRTNDGLTVTDRGMDYLKSIGFSD